jgi:hypothetical protein
LSEQASEKAAVVVAYDQVDFWSAVKLVAVTAGGFIILVFLLLGIASLLGFETVHYKPSGGPRVALTGPPGLFLALAVGSSLVVVQILVFSIGWAALRKLRPWPGLKIHPGRPRRCS